MSAPTRLVIDCSLAGVPDPEVAARFEDSAVAAFRAGDLEKATQLMDEAKDVLARSAVAAAEEVALTADELAQRDTDQAAGLEQRKTQRRLELESVLAWTDRWAARAVEEAVPMTAARIRYRQQLRTLFATIDAATDVAAVEAVTVPKPPANP